MNPHVVSIYYRDLFLKTYWLLDVKIFIDGDQNSVVVNHNLGDNCGGNETHDQMSLL